MIRRTFLGFVTALLWPFGLKAVEKPRPSPYPGLADFKWGPWQECESHDDRYYRDGSATVVSPVLYKRDWPADSSGQTTFHLAGGIVQVQECRNPHFDDGKPFLFIIGVKQAEHVVLPEYRFPRFTYLEGEHGEFS